MTAREDQDLAHSDARFTTVDDTLAEVLEKVQHMHDKMIALEKEMKKMAGILEAWDTVQNGARFLKWIGILAGSFIAVWAFVKAVAKGVWP